MAPATDVAHARREKKERRERVGRRKKKESNG
jgi:hypothetical protein